MQEQIKADMEAMKGKMTTMMEAMMDMRKIMEVKVAAANTATKRDPTHLPVFNQESHLVSDVEGQGGATRVTAYGPQYTQSHNRYTFPPYGLAPNYTPLFRHHSKLITTNTSSSQACRIMGYPSHVVLGGGRAMVHHKFSTSTKRA